ncbi:hypothetical protein CU098_008867 [Rhizopus stolonifer]|uniref:Epidermal growth factor receptor substrate 15 n=1 Tax=Rhizopus stolonifer TaxID=4846 RepID=A0A367KPK8_RHIST|nr:hypothetical protein CU098_008867 [Rhizopus stolonifer]
MSFWDSQLSPQEAKYYSQLFQYASKSQEGIVTGNEAVQFFATSGVPTQILSEIWEAADRDKVGYLTPETFAIALKLIACAQHGQEASANILSTAVPLPQFDGANIVAPSPIVPNNSASLANALITDAEREKYANIFQVHQPVNGVLDAETAKNVFLKSKLPMDILSQIWYLADVRQSGTLNQTEFIIAMHYIAKLMDGTLTSLPDKLPPSVFQSVNGGSSTPLTRNMTISSPSFHKAHHQSVMTPPQRARTIDSLGSIAFGPSAPIHEPVQQWDVTAQEKQQFDAYFDKIDSNRTGVIQGKEAVEFFKNSRLPEAELAHIWDLADIQQRGALSRDEFAVAMHLIHQKLAGKPLPQVLPKTLIPPSHANSRSQSQQSPFSNSNAVAPSPSIFASPAPQSNRSLIDDSGNNDLLGDFANDQVSHETNQINLMQNQISSLSLQTQDIGNQKVSAENTLEQLTNQKKELEAQLTNVRMAHEAAVKDLNELQETVRREEGEWDRVRAEHDAAQQQLNTIQNEIAQARQTLENGRAETESLRRSVHDIQEETRLANQELENMRAQTKQQNMMLDINRRQVTAAEQDRAQAKRHLEDYKVAGGLNNGEEEDSSESENELPVNSTNTAANTHIEATKSVASPEIESSVVSTPALTNLFAESPVPKSNSPFAEFDTASSTFDAAFASPAPATASSNAGQDDFDAIFGTMGSTSSTTTPVNAFDSVNWAIPSATTPTKTSRAPPPPPPQSRHHRQTSEVSSIASVTSPSLTSSGSIKKAHSFKPATQIQEKNEEDDFEAAFSGDLHAAKVVTKDDDFADFDDAFISFDTKPPQTGRAVSPQTTTATPVTNNNWAVSFGEFDFPNEKNKPTNTTANDDEWDSIFGTNTNTAPSAAGPASSSSVPTTDNAGFDDAFASFGDDFGKQQSQKPAVNNIGIVGDKIEELVKMGFAESEAKDALNRYDQDLEKASNFLLDQSSKR